MSRILLSSIAVALGACASVSTIPLSKNSFQLTTKATPECSAEQTRNIAFKRAAAETIKQGYDSFVVTDAKQQPLLYSDYMLTGGVSQISNQSLSVTMYREGDPAGADALSARTVLGPKWQEALGEESFSCYGA